MAAGQARAVSPQGEAGGEAKGNARGEKSLSGRLPRSFYARPPTEVAPDLLGRVLVMRTGRGPRLAARIVETEAYQEDDPASHAFRGPTPRNAVMFGPPGHLYVYFTYGMHYCMNVVTGARGEASAVLLRAAEPLEGIDEMTARRGDRPPAELCSGPARLCQAFGIDRSFGGLDLVAGGVLWLEAGHPAEPKAILSGSRVGVRVGMDRPWRYRIAGDPWVSRGRPALPDPPTRRSRSRPSR